MGDVKSEEYDFFGRRRDQIAPKGQLQPTAQGNALGSHGGGLKALKGRPNVRLHGMGRPFRALIHDACLPRAALTLFALPWAAVRVPRCGVGNRGAKVFTSQIKNQR